MPYQEAMQGTRVQMQAGESLLRRSAQMTCMCRMLPARTSKGALLGMPHHPQMRPQANSNLATRATAAAYRLGQHFSLQSGAC